MNGEEQTVRQASEGDTVRVQYTGKSRDGRVFYASGERGPVRFTIGDGRIISGFGRAVVGMTPGESRTVTVPWHQAFGPHRDDLVTSVRRNQLPTHLEPHVGQRLQLSLADDQAVEATVIDVSQSNVVLDVNHPLAGQDLVFEIELVEIV